MPPEANSQSSHTLLFVKAGTAEDFFLGIRNSTSSNALESSDSDGDLLERTQNTLEIKPAPSLQAVAVYSKPVKQRSRSQPITFLPTSSGSNGYKLSPSRYGGENRAEAKR